MKNKITVIVMIFSMLMSVFTVSASEYMSKEIVYEMDFETDNHGFSPSNGTIENKDGMMIVTFDTSVPYMFGETFTIKAEDVSEIVVRAKAEKTGIYKIYFITTDHGSWSEDYKFDIAMPGGKDLVELRIDTKACKNWKGTIKRFRIDYPTAEKANVVTTDYIRLLGKEVSSVTTDETGFRYEFTNNSKKDGFGVNEYFANPNVVNGTLTGNMTSENAEIYSHAMIPFAAHEYGNIVLKYCNNTPAEKAYVYFACDGSGGKYSDDYRFEVETVPYDNEIREYDISVGNNKNWKGNISGIKVVFGAAEGSVAIDEINFKKYPYTISTDNDTLVVSGKVTPNDKVSIQIVKPEYEDGLDDVVQSGNYGEAIIFTDEFKSGNDGSINFSFPLTPDEEPQDFVVMIADSNSAYTSRVSYIDSGYADRALVRINNAVDAKVWQDIYDEITKAYQYIGINAEGYYDFIGNCTNIVDFAKQFAACGKVSNLTELETNVSKAAIYGVIMGTGDGNIVTAAEKYENTLKLKEKASYSIFEAFADKEKTEILVKAREEAGNVEEYADSFAKISILYGIKFSIGTDAVRNIIEDNAAEIGIDLDILDGISNTDEIYRRIAGKTYASYDEVAEALENAINEYEEDEKQSQSSAPSGGGGGGGGITNVNQAVIIPQTTQQSEKNGVIFSDLSGHWARENVEKLYAKGIVSGRTNNIFDPDDVVTREEFVKMTVLALGITGDSTMQFTDVDQNAWYSSYVAKAANAGIITGNSDGSFGVGEHITRQDMAVIIYRAIKDMQKKEGDAVFADYELISDYAKEAVGALVAEGIINGMGDGNFAPKANATRAQAAVIIGRVAEYIGG